MFSIPTIRHQSLLAAVVRTGHIAINLSFFCKKQSFRGEDISRFCRKYYVEIGNSGLFWNADAHEIAWFKYYTQKSQKLLKKQGFSRFFWNVFKNSFYDILLAFHIIIYAFLIPTICK